LICRSNPYDRRVHVQHREVILTSNNNEYDDDGSVTIVQDSKFEVDGCIYRVTFMSTTRVNALCFYPLKHENPLFGTEKVFDRVLTKELIRQRLNG
jgi:hypothetical protein